MIIANTLFQKPKSRYWTWESPDGDTRNQTDFTLSSQRGIVTNCEVITKADKGSDHRLIRMTLRINKRLARLKTKKTNKQTNKQNKKKKQKSFNIDTEKLRGMKEIFEINLNTDLKNLRRR